MVTMDLALSVLTQLLLAAPAERHASRAPPPPAASSASASAAASAAVAMQRLRELATAELQTSYLMLAHQLKRLMPKEVKVCVAFRVPIPIENSLSSCEVAHI